MDFSKEPLLQLIELSIIGELGAYREVFKRLEDIPRTCFWKLTQDFSYDVDIADFIGFAWAWILEKNKLYSLYYRFREDMVPGKEAEPFLKRYYYSIARSAVLAFLKEEFPAFRRRGKQVINPATGEKEWISDYLEVPFTEYYEEDVPVVSSVMQNKEELTVYAPEKMLERENAEELLKELFTTISEFEQRKRVSFWLVYFSRLFPLPEIDIEWLAEINACGKEDVRMRIEEGIEDNIGHMYSVSYDFAGKILCESANTVTVRNRRLMVKLDPKFQRLMET